MVEGEGYSEREHQIESLPQFCPQVYIVSNEENPLALTEAT